MSDPVYVPPGALQVFPPPTRCAGVEMYSFFARGDRDSLQALCDRTLNAPTNGEVNFRVLSEHVMVTFQSIEKLQSLTSPAMEMGYTSEREAAFWVLVADEKKWGPLNLIENVRLLIPYIYTDSGWAVAGGRELYGFPKQLARVVMPTSQAPRAAFEIHTEAFRRFSAQGRSEHLEVLSIDRVDRDTGLLEGLWHGFKQIVLEGIDDVLSLLDGDLELTLPGLGAVEAFIRCLFQPSLPMVFLKQFRDVSTTTGACYQAIIAAEGKDMKLHGLRLLFGEYRMRLADLDSQPIARDLGLEVDTNGEVALLNGPVISYDFVLDEGEILWEARRPWTLS